MQFKRIISGFVTLVMLAAVSPGVEAAPKGKTYDESTFIKTFGGKSKKQITEALGQPLKKEQSVKPTNADSFLPRSAKEDKSKPVNVEMWYYANVVKYDATHTYKSTELTFVNDSCQNIAFFNNK